MDLLCLPTMPSEGNKYLICSEGIKSIFNAISPASTQVNLFSQRLQNGNLCSYEGLFSWKWLEGGTLQRAENAELNFPEAESREIMHEWTERRVGIRRVCLTYVGRDEGLLKKLRDEPARAA